MGMNKPSILIYINEADPDILNEVCAGIEEEGIPYEIFSKEEMDLEYLSFNSANDSILGAGIGIFGGKVALSLRSLPRGTYIYYLENPTDSESRNIGANGARAVKRMPFKD
ncbi:dehydratase medium subunit [Mobilisporobacter senegalensis]|uniref:Dehydratase medium subunit n=1 Tax=Mobilisporobacter senegalensis TaxID=1329262 RepID=A0A3N1XR35_9FIRM|nr:glycerol dehydratase reactivase beta/small subunit family protein [Mobilisporobacter senegalensis]ROR29096.1 dehydratase medium subunit [Mobilisporobacter senegalensis]